ncbi:MAG: hypothetical protein A3F67_00065 [Verrucomicrobia bacterium RIFCSPHIGHO2_12_FULL_41_10]|nr:MAG: hypothetical protein A3F67_00065 [Verrucomicrobia bacterium RIFCSPHIGHO2_12_FULL_41_10]HLB33101.1 amidohydrolase family protein [Chthoniobacterales bacterium]
MKEEEINKDESDRRDGRKRIVASCLHPDLHFYRARYMLPMSSPPIEDGAVLVDNGQIIDLGCATDLRKKYPEATYHDLGEVILLPGLINAHCHLDYTMMRGKIRSGGSFTNWVKELNRLKFSYREEDFLAAITEGMEELSAWGCTTAVNIASFPELIPKLPCKYSVNPSVECAPTNHQNDLSNLNQPTAYSLQPIASIRPVGRIVTLPLSPLRLWHLMEVMDIRGAKQGEEGMRAVEDFLRKEPRFQGGWGISPHAPQTVSKELYRSARNMAEGYHVPFCTHLAESEEEFEMFTKGSGFLFDFLKGLGRNMKDCGARSSIQLLLEEDLLPRGALLVHMNILSKKDRELLAKRANDFFVIHCPRTHRFFERAPFDWKFFHEQGYRLSLGTDSLASNEDFNLFAEMRAMVATAPELDPEEILKMVTLHPAAAIGMAGKLGELSCGAFADMITIPFTGALKDVFAAVIASSE